MYKKKKKKSFLHHMHQFVLAFYALIYVMHHFFLASHASICSCIVCINSFIAYHKNDLEILMVTTAFLVSKSNHQIKRY